MTSIHGGPPAAGRTRVTRRLDVSEARCFARDLRGSLTHVLVAAAGRSLAADGRGDKESVALAVVHGRALDVVVLPGAGSAPLPILRREVDAVLDHGAAVSRLPRDTVDLAVLDVDAPRSAVDTVLGRSRYVLETTPCDDDPRSVALVLHAEGDEAALDHAETLLRSVSRFVEQPYRRLA